jgi:outer membrane receptor protein involved in Fe transport
MLKWRQRVLFRTGRYWVYVASVVFLFGAATAAPAQQLSLTGQAVNRDAAGNTFAVPGAKISLTRVSGGSPGQPAIPAVESDGGGVFRFNGLARGCYLATAKSPGLVGQSDAFCLPLTEGQSVTIAMTLDVVLETVEVTAAAVAIDPTETSSTGSVGLSTISDAPKANKRYEDVLPLIPGVLRGPSGEMNMNGSRAAQAGAQFNGVDVTDPVSGTSSLNVPIEAVSNVQVLSNPYDAQYGGFAGAMSTVQTKPANFQDLKFSLQNFGPRLRRRDGAIMGVESITPRLTMTGPLQRGKIAFFTSTEYQFVRADQENANLPLLERDVEREALNIFAEVQVRHTDRNITTGGVLIYPEKLNYYGLDAFNLQGSTPDLRRRGFLYTLRNRRDFDTGAALVSQFSYQDLANDVKPRGEDDYVVGVEKARGSFYYRQQRDSRRGKFSERYTFAPLEKAGTHRFQTGLAFVNEAYHDRQMFRPISWLGAGDRLAFTTAFGPAADLSASKREYAAYFQDTWTVSRSLTLDLGLRLERDSIAAKWNPAYRAGFAYAVGGASRTVLRGGAGLFYDGLSLAVPTFSLLPMRTETTYDGRGSPIESTAYSYAIRDRLRNPKSLGASLQLDRELARDLFLRLGYQVRRTKRNLLVEREVESVLDPLNRTGFFTLSNEGRDNYREWQMSTRYRLPARGHLTFSYVRSSAGGDLNAFGSLFGAVPFRLLRENERAQLPFDSPNRFLIWSEVGLPFGLRAVPVVEWRSGFPYSTVDELRNYVGPRNRTGRLPSYRSLDLQISRVLTFHVLGKARSIRVGARLFNLLNDYNPQDVQESLVSPNYGVFYRGIKRKLRMMFEFGG